MENRLNADKLAEKIFDLTEQFNRYVFEHPEILDTIPEQATLIFLDADDPEFNQANLRLLDSRPHPPGSQPIYIQMRKQVRLVEQIDWDAVVLVSPQMIVA